MQENKSQYQGNDNAQLVDGHDFGRLSDLQSLVVAQLMAVWKPFLLHPCRFDRT